MFGLDLVCEHDAFGGNKEFKFSAAAGIFKAWPLLALLSPVGPPASRAGRAQGRWEGPLSCGGHGVEPGRRHHQDVQDGVGHLGAGPLVDSCGLVVLGSACQDGKVDVVQWALGNLSRTNVKILKTACHSSLDIEDCNKL